MDYKGVKKVCKSCEFRFRNGNSYICANAFSGEKITDVEKRIGKGEKDCWHIGYKAFEQFVDGLPNNERIKYLNS